MLMIIFIIFVITFLLIALYKLGYFDSLLEGDANIIPLNLQRLLEKHVDFYNSLPHHKKSHFKERVEDFLREVPIKGVRTQVDDLTKTLVAASAVIPIFNYPEWRYYFLNKVIIYSSAFYISPYYKKNNIKALGLVGTGKLEGKVFLSKPALIKGFQSLTDHRNVGIHEFLHIIDQQDGAIDGFPEEMLPAYLEANWLDLIYSKTQEIKSGNSDIRKYATANRAEFFCVVSEYFFENPEGLKKNNPKLFSLLNSIFTPN